VKCWVCSVDDDQDTTSYGGAPYWYWRLASHMTTWRSELAFWLLLAALGFVLGFVAGWLL